MNYMIIGVHGLNKKPKPAQLEDGWRKSISEGLCVNQGIDISPKELNFHMCYWADVFYGNDYADPVYQPAVKESHLKKYKDRWYESAIASVADLGDGAIEFLKGRGMLDNASGWLLENKLDNLHFYYEEKDKREKCRKTVVDALNEHAGKTIILVTHSMGTIVSYDVARILGNQDSNTAIEHFVTMGCPLGLPHVKNEIKREFKSTRTPSIVKNWTNFADRRDPVCFDTHLRGDYSKNKDGVKAEDDRVMNDWGIEIGQNPLWAYHKSYGYLRTPEFSELLAKYF